VSIKDELQRKLDNNIERNVELKAKVKEEIEAKQTLEREARNMIIEFIIPFFRKITAHRPKTTYLYVLFHWRAQESLFKSRRVITYKTTIDDWSAPKSKPLFMSAYDWRVYDHAVWHDSPYDKEVVRMALALAREYDIQVRLGHDDEECDEFYLRLT
jgi:hypothetical protein